MCPAWSAANRVLYGLLVRLVINFRISHVLDAKPNTHPTKFNVTPAELVARPGPWGAVFTPRETFIGRMPESIS